MWSYNTQQNPKKHFKAIVAAISIYFFAVSIQYFDSTLFTFNQQVEFWALAPERISEIGIQRYVKDAYLLGFSLLWVYWYVKVNGSTRKLLYLFAVESGIICLGVVGHILDFSGVFIVAGMRWVVLLHCSVGMYLLLDKAIQERQRISYVAKTVKLMVVLSLVVAVIQWVSVGQPALGSFRIYSIYSNAGVYGYTMIGAAFFFLSYFKDRGKKLTSLLLCFSGALLSGTRSSMLIVMGCVFISLLPNKKLKKGSGVIWFFLFALFAVVLLITLNLVDDLSQRGRVADNLTGSGGRGENLWIFFQNADGFGLIQNLFGRGLGSGTNSIHVFTSDASLLLTSWDYPVDSTLLPIYQQFGIAGGIAFSFFALRYFPRFVRFNGGLLYKAAGWYLIFAVSILCFTQNMLEAFSFLPLFFMTAALHFNRFNLNKPL